MCGIYGVLSLAGQRPDRYTVEHMGYTMRQSGSDYDGIQVDDELIFGMQRMPIIDGDQAEYMTDRMAEAAST